MAYLTCPWCLTPQLIADEAPEYRCYTCAAEVRFFKCPNCSLVQTVSKQWRMFTCGKLRHEAGSAIPVGLRPSVDGDAGRGDGEVVAAAVSL